MYPTDSKASPNAGTASCGFRSAEPTRYACFYASASPKPVMSR